MEEIQMGNPNGEVNNQPRIRPIKTQAPNEIKAKMHNTMPANKGGDVNAQKSASFGTLGKGVPPNAQKRSEFNTVPKNLGGDVNSQKSKLANTMPSGKGSKSVNGQKAKTTGN